MLNCISRWCSCPWRSLLMGSCVGHATQKQRETWERSLLKLPSKAKHWALPTVWLHSLAADTLTYSKISPLWQLWQPKLNLLLPSGAVTNRLNVYCILWLIGSGVLLSEFVINVLERDSIAGHLKVSSENRSKQFVQSMPVFIVAARSLYRCILGLYWMCTVAARTKNTSIGIASLFKSETS